MNLLTKQIVFCVIPMLPMTAVYAADMDMSHMSMGDMQGMNHSQMNMDRKPIQKVKPIKKVHKSKPMADMKGMDHSQKPMADMKEMDHSQMSMADMQGMHMQNNTPPADARNPDYSQGHDFAMMPPHMMGNGMIHGVMLDRVEVTNDGDKTGFALHAVSWLGTDNNRVVFKLDTSNTTLEKNTLTTSLAWRKPVRTFWNYDLGVQNDHENGKPNQSWLMANINGIAPYWFNLDGTVLLGKSGLVGVVFDGSYDLRITQRLILDPSLSVKLYNKDDPDQEIGRGLSNGSVGLRLRYEVMRTFAPYVSVDFNRYFGRTANFYNAKEGRNNETIVSMGVRSWF